MIRAAVIALPLLLMRPLAEPGLFPHVGIRPGEWSRRLKRGPLAALPLPGAQDMAAGQIGRPALAGASLGGIK
jgi:hypothetical protein